MERHIGFRLVGLMFIELCNTSKMHGLMFIQLYPTSKCHDLMHNMSLYMSETRENRMNEYNKEQIRGREKIQHKVTRSINENRTIARNDIL
jgi:hypothetical protein